MNGYDLSRKFVDFSFENPSKIKPNHYALYFFSIEHCNRLGWKKEFGLPTTMTMEAIGIKSYKTYIATFEDLERFGFYNVVERSKNQYSSNIIELVNYTEAQTKALDKAFLKHGTKHCQSTDQLTVSINKPLTIKPLNHLYSESDFLKNWGTLRKKFLKKETHINKLDTMERSSFNIALKDFSKEDINHAMVGLFKQENKNIGSMYLRPKHFLENVDKYLSAYKSKEFELYGKEYVKPSL